MTFFVLVFEEMTADFGPNSSRGVFEVDCSEDFPFSYIINQDLNKGRKGKEDILTFGFEPTDCISNCFSPPIGSSFRRFLSLSKNKITTKINNRAIMPPITPPAMTPALFPEAVRILWVDGEDVGEVEVGDKEGEEVEIGVGVGVVVGVGVGVGLVVEIGVGVGVGVGVEDKEGEEVEVGVGVGVVVELGIGAVVELGVGVGVGVGEGVTQ